MRILLVEDSSPLRCLFARLLTLSGHVVSEAADGEEALERLTGPAPDLVLTDLMMPVLDGVGLIRRLKADPSLAGLPVIAMTAVAGGGDRALEAGADRVLAKPLDLDVLLSCLGDPALSR